MINRLKTQRKFEKIDLALQKTTTRSPAASKSPLSTYTRRQHTPSNERYFKRSSKSPLLTRYRNFFKTDTQSFQNNQPEPLLSQLKSRKTQKNPQKPSPHLAQSVLKLYFLPFFQEQQKLDTDKRRIISYGNSQKPKPPQYFKSLSEILQEILNKQKSKLALIQSKLASVQKEKSNMKNELISIKSSNFTSIINLNVLPSTSNSALVPTQSLLSIVSSCQSEKIEFFKVFTESISLKRTLTKEKWNNEDLKNQSIQSSFHNYEFYMINQISGESLKGAYYSLSALKNPALTENLLYQIQLSLKSSHQIFIQKNDSSFSIFSALFADHEKYLQLSKPIIKQRALAWKDLKSLKTVVISYLDNLLNIIKTSNTQKKKIIEEFENKEKEFFKFIEDYKSVQDKVEEMQKASRGKRPELLCKFCKKEYFDDENFNWSCCSHPSEWSGSMYWCCGAKEKLSIGCYKRRHEEENNEDGEEGLQVLEYNKEKLIVKFCTGCKKTGHFSSDCDKDPNKLKFVKNIKIKDVGKIKKKVLEVNRSLSSRNLWVNTKKKKENESFEDIKEIKRLASRNVTPDQSLYTQTSARSVFSSPSRTLTTLHK